MKNIILSFFAVISMLVLNAQAPQKMSYQAVLRYPNGDLISNTMVGMQISILQGTSIGLVVYSETQQPIANTNGLVSLEIGTGNVVLGTFSGIDWSQGPYFIKTETDPTGGSAYNIAGTSELLSVPYALYALSGTPGPQGTPGFLTGGSNPGNTPYWNGINWVTDSSNIFNNGGNVGIGTLDSPSDLNVVGNQSLFQNNGTQTGLLISNGSVPPQAVRIMLMNDSVPGVNSKWSMVKDYFTQSGQDDLVWEYVSTYSVVSTPLVIKGHSGNVGIGTNSPARRLHVNAVMRLEPIPAPPDSPAEGDMYMNSITHKLMVYDGTQWRACW